MKKQWQYKGILPAMVVPFNDDCSIDEKELRRFTGWLLSHEGIGGLVPNGHTGEVFALSAKERAEVTRIVFEQAEGKVPVVSGVCCEGINEACEHAGLLVEAGAEGALVMPPHMWLRFGMRPEHVIDYFNAIGESSGLDLIVHVYPAWTRASYSTELMVELARLPHVKAFKVGTRELNKYARDITAIRNATPDVTILTCHDEYLLASMVQGVDGALVGFASMIPEMIIDLFEAVKRGNLKEAMDIQFRINPLKEVVYGLGEPTGEAHSRMKTAMALMGRLRSATVRPPIRQPDSETVKRIEEALENVCLLQRQAVG